jgi:hypothetical protein
MLSEMANLSEDLLNYEQGLLFEQFQKESKDIYDLLIDF